MRRTDFTICHFCLVSHLNITGCLTTNFQKSHIWNILFFSLPEAIGLGDADIDFNEVLFKNVELAQVFPQQAIAATFVPIVQQ